MAKAINNMDELAIALQPVMKKMVDNMANRVYKTLNFFLQGYYDSYDPIYYRRQYDFLRSGFKVDARIIRGKAVASVYIDVDYMSNYYGVTGQQVATWANEGLHGGKNLATNTPHVWDETMANTVDNGALLRDSGHDKEDCYYRNLYPLNQEQFRIVNNHFQKTGDDSEQFILNVMNDIRYKPDNWSKQTAKRVMYGVGYHGILYTNSNEESYKRWHWIMNRCYSNAIHELQPEYKDCTVCEEWLNYSNFKLWYEQHIVEIRIYDEAFELDKDILIKGNTVYSSETVCFVPKMINSLFTNGKKNRGDYPLGVYFDKDKKKYIANMSFAGKNIKLGAYETVEAAFLRYKEYKEDFIKDIAEQHKDKIPDKIYQAMMNWQIEITD